MKQNDQQFKRYVQKAAAIRRGNVERHDKAAAVATLRRDIQRNVENTNRQFEYSRLLAGSVRHNGLDHQSLNRLHELKRIIR